MKKSFGADAVLLFSLIIFFGGVSSAFAIAVAIIMHESGHITAIKLFGGRVGGIRANASGFCMSYSGIENGMHEAVCILTGPLFGLILAFAASFIGNNMQSEFMLKISGYSLILSAYNLLPALPLDGGRALNIILSALFSEKTAENAISFLGVSCGLGLVVLGLIFHTAMYGLAIFVAGIIVLSAQTGIVKSLKML